jgi:hypothetical protein
VSKVKDTLFFSTYLRRNTVLRCGNPRSFTPSKLPRVILARLVLLATKPKKLLWCNTALRCGNPQSFTPSKFPRVILARLVLLATKPKNVFAAQYGVALWQPSVIYAT